MEHERRSTGGLDAVVGVLESLYRDADLAPVKAWKAAHQGGRAIGHLPITFPRELAHAAGMLPVGIVGNGEIEIIRGDAYFQSYICHLPRSVLELAVSGRLDVLDGVVFPATCDVIRNLSGMWKLLFPNKYSKYLDVPQNFAAAIGGEFYVEELRALRADFEQLSGQVVTDDALRASIAVYNRQRAAVGRLFSARREMPWQVLASEVYLLMRAGLVLEVNEHIALIEDFLAAAAAAPRQPMDNIRVVIAGAFCEQPPLDLVRTLERAGCYIVDDDFVLGLRWCGVPIAVEGDPIGALATAYLDHGVHCASRFEQHGNNGAALVARCRAARAEGVIFAAPSFCDPALLDQPMAANALEVAGIPYTAFKYAENTGQYQVIREQAGTFSDSVRLWGTA